MRKTKFINGQYYHIYNRGVDKRNIFINRNDYERFLLCLRLLNDEEGGQMLLWRDFKRTNPRAKLLDFSKLNSIKKPLVEFNAYCLNPNHMHFIIKQISHAGIRKFMHKIGTSYTNYFNIKYERSGSLFQGPFKSIPIDSNEYLLYLSAYINRNYFIHGYGQDTWKYSSLLDYLGKRRNDLCSLEPILSQFDNNVKKYEEFLCDNALYMKEVKETKRYLLE